MGKTIILDTFEKAKQYAGRKVRSANGTTGVLIGFDAGTASPIIDLVDGWSLRGKEKELFDPKVAQSSARGWCIGNEVELLDGDSVTAKSKLHPHVCYCKAPCYMTARSVECTNPACRHYVPSAEKETGLVDVLDTWTTFTTASTMLANPVPNPIPTSKTWTIPAGAGGTISGTPPPPTQAPAPSSVMQVVLISIDILHAYPSLGFKTEKRRYSDGTTKTSVLDATGAIHMNHPNADPNVTYP